MVDDWVEYIESLKNGEETAGVNHSPVVPVFPMPPPIPVPAIKIDSKLKGK